MRVRSRSQRDYLYTEAHPLFFQRKTVHTPLAQFHSRSYRKPSPYGVTLIMSPWNYPFLLTFDPLVDAIAAGNTAVLKPSAYSPATSNIICEIVRECFPEEYVAVMGGRGKLLSSSGALRLRLFYRQPGCRKEVMRHASEHLTPVTLELGEKAPASWINLQILSLPPNVLYSENI